MNRSAFSSNVVFFALLFSSIVFSGCSSQPTLGQRMMEQSSDTADLGQQWELGKKKVIKGEKLLQDGNELIKDAKDDMRKGEDKVSEGKELIDEGKRLMADSERKYKTKFPAAL